MPYICTVRTKTSIYALIQLMDDQDPMVIEHAKNVLLDYGEEIIPELEQIEDISIDEPARMGNVSEVLRHLRLKKVKKALSAWITSRDKNLIEALYIISSYQFPELGQQDFMKQLQTIRHRCWIAISSKQTSFEKVEAFNRVFYEEFDFVRLKKAYYSPFEIFVNTVMETKEGTDLSLGLIYSIIAQSLDLPIYGVASTNKRVPFMLAYLDKTNLLPILNWGVDNNGVLFYIDVSLKGLIIDPKHLKELYQQKGLPVNKSQFEPSPNTTIVKKLLNDIKLSYSNHSYYRYKLLDIEELLKLF